MAEQITITKSKLILVEGPTDKAFFQSLVNFMGLENQIQIEEYGGLASKDEGELAIRFTVYKSWWNWNHPAFSDVHHFVELVATP